MFSNRWRIKTGSHSPSVWWGDITSSNTEEPQKCLPHNCHRVQIPHALKRIQSNHLFSHKGWLEEGIAHSQKCTLLTASAEQDPRPQAGRIRFKRAFIIGWSQRHSIVSASIRLRDRYIELCNTHTHSRFYQASLDWIVWTLTHASAFRIPF